MLHAQHEEASAANEAPVARLPIFAEAL